eukprot:1154512-Pelagomonas_calceolata.AAC.2
MGIYFHDAVGFHSKVTCKVMVVIKSNYRLNLEEGPQSRLLTASVIMVTVGFDLQPDRLARLLGLLDCAK